MTRPTQAKFPVLLLVLFLALNAGLLFACIHPAHAQNTLPEPQLEMPGTSEPALYAADAPAPEQAAAPAQQARAVKTGGGADPCPTPQAAIENAPDDMAKVQEEIDRFTLCVERAQLLERLNESILKNQAGNDLSMGLSAAVPGMAGAQQSSGGAMDMPMLPANALGGADVAPAMPAAPAATTDTTTAVAEEPKKDEEEPKAWTISDVFGSSNDIQARLISPEGDEVKVRNGQKLPDGTTVIRITPAGVTVRSNGNNSSLEWKRS